MPVARKIAREHLDEAYKLFLEGNPTADSHYEDGCTAIQMSHKFGAEPVFAPDRVYPEDTTGAYIDLKGIIVKIRSYDDYKLSVQTARGVFTLYNDAPYLRTPLRLGQRVTIRIYAMADGYYPNGKILVPKAREAELGK